MAANWRRWRRCRRSSTAGAASTPVTRWREGKPSDPNGGSTGRCGRSSHRRGRSRQQRPGRGWRRRRSAPSSPGPATVMWLLDAFLIVAIPLLVEARRAARHERAQRARGGFEPAGDVYKLMRIAYPAAFAAMLAEAAVRERGAPPTFAAGIFVFAAAKALKWWAILTLGPSW